MSYNGDRAQYLESGAANVIRGWLTGDEIISNDPPVCRKPTHRKRSRERIAAKNLPTKKVAHLGRF
jgi:hypothetical protein